MTAPLNTCREVLADISGYLDGELETTACEAIQQHCLTCSGCAALVKGLQETVGLCRQAARTPVPEAVRRRARERVRRLLGVPD